MIYFLDANAIIDILNGNKSILAKIASLPSLNNIHIPDIAYYEVMRGFAYKPNPKLQQHFDYFSRLFGIEYQTQNSLNIAAEQYATLLKKGTPIEDDDILIGSLAIANEAILVSNNTKHLSRLQNIQLENWAE